MDAWWEERSLPQKVLLGIGFGIAGIGLLALFGWVVMLLWNWIVPDLLGLARIDFWKAWGLVALCTILFKGLGAANGKNQNGQTDRKRKEHLRHYVQDEGTAPAGAAGAEQR